jgi:hypothetical protein
MYTLAKTPSPRRRVRSTLSAIAGGVQASLVCCVVLRSSVWSHHFSPAVLLTRTSPRHPLAVGDVVHSAVGTTVARGSPIQAVCVDVSGMYAARKALQPFQCSPCILTNCDVTSLGATQSCTAPPINSRSRPNSASAIDIRSLIAEEWRASHTHKSRGCLHVCQLTTVPNWRVLAGRRCKVSMFAHCKLFWGSGRVPPDGMAGRGAGAQVRHAPCAPAVSAAFSFVTLFCSQVMLTLTGSHAALTPQLATDTFFLFNSTSPKPTTPPTVSTAPPSHCSEGAQAGPQVRRLGGTFSAALGVPERKRPHRRARLCATREWPREKSTHQSAIRHPRHMPPAPRHASHRPASQPVHTIAALTPSPTPRLTNCAHIFSRDLLGLSSHSSCAVQLD